MQKTMNIRIDYSRIKEFDDIPFHGSPLDNNIGLPRGIRGKEKEYQDYCELNNIDISNLTKEEVEEIIKKL